MRGADVIQKVLSNTRFSVEEVDRFHLVFNQLSESEVITQQSFKTLLEMMGIRISKQMEDRIFDVIAGVEPTDSVEERKIDFPTLMDYFNTILKGQKKDQIRFCYNLIDREQKGYFTGDDLRQLLYDLKQVKPEDKDDLEDYISSFFELLKCDPRSNVTLSMFEDRLETDEKSYLLVNDILSVESSFRSNKSIKVLTQILGQFCDFMRKCSIVTKTEEILSKDKRGNLGQIGIKRIKKAQFKMSNDPSKNNFINLDGKYMLTLPEDDMSRLSNSQMLESKQL